MFSTVQKRSIFKQRKKINLDDILEQIRKKYSREKTEEYTRFLFGKISFTRKFTNKNAFNNFNFLKNYKHAFQNDFPTENTIQKLESIIKL